jgi:pimeloyl-ACP methyl ester carboxylesterase
MWAYQVAQLSEGYRCISYDRRGHGRSDPAAGGFDMDTLSDDLASVIDGLGLKDVTLVGHSMGCAEIIHYLARHGTGKVRNVAMLAPATPYLVKTDDNPYGVPMANYDKLMASWRTGFHKWMRDNQAPFFTPDTPMPIQDWLTAQMLSTPIPVAIATFRANLGDRRPDLAKIDRPVLILHGDKDASAFLDFTGRRVAAGIKGSELKVYPGAPHGLFVTHMEQVNRDLETFLKA